MANVVKLSVFVCDMARFGEVAEARAEFFTVPHPASTMFEVSRLVSADQLVEIEAIAAMPPRNSV